MKKMTDAEKIIKILTHIRHVQENCRHLGMKLMDSKETRTIGLRLIANSMLHDNSKFHGCEWDYLFEPDVPAFTKMAVSHHNRTNPHHPEAWGCIDVMPVVYVAEMVCDWKARSTEFGTDFMQWVKIDATKRYDFKLQSAIGLFIMKFAEMLCEPPFKRLASKEPKVTES